MNGFVSDLTIGPQIGNGWFGVVHKAVDPVHGTVAVKIPKQRPGEPQLEWESRRDALLQEAQHLKQATHQNVVQVYSVLKDPTNDDVHLVMEFCAGGSLQKRFERGPMLLAPVRRIFTDLAFGLQALHARNMLHRDIKPANILMTRNIVAKLGDFGLVTDNIVLGYASQAGYRDHVAYEVWHGHGTSIRTDIWAFGMTMYRLLHGEDWYSRSPHPQDIVEKGGFANTLKWLPHIPKKWRRVIRKMLSDDPDARYQSANEVVSALATLSTEPRWSCTVAGSQIRWQRRMDGRRMIVTWTAQTKHKHEWAAWSGPTAGAGRRYTFGRSNGLVSAGVADKELRDFFASQET